MELADVFLQLGVALGLGLLVGLQRERTDSRLAGFRTFPLVTLLGSICALLARDFGGWILALGLLAVALIILVGHLSVLKSGEDAKGITTEAALLVMFGVGAYLMVGSPALATALGGTTAVLLHLKPQMHALARRLGERDFKAIMQFALISLVVLPVLPNAYYGPYLVLNPFKIWLMVVLIVGISVGGYILYKFLGARVGTWAGGVLGGLISSTATTVSYARRTREAPETSPHASFVILLASAVVFVRVAILIGAMAPHFLRAAAVPLSIMFVLLAGQGLWIWRVQKDSATRLPPQGNPSELKPALIFAVLYALVLLGVATAREYFGQSGLYIVATLSGLTDMDAITLSVTQMVQDSKVAPDTGWRLILIAGLSNLLFKAGVVAFIGSRALLGRVAVAFGVAFAAGLALLWLWN